MEISTEVLYKKNTIPLESVMDLAIGEEYYCKEGHCLVYNGENNFEVVRQSPLISEEYLSDIKDDAILRLFWVLSKGM